MRCYSCRRTVTADDSAIRGRYVPSHRWKVKVDYREFRRVRLCRECLGPMGWKQALRQPGAPYEVPVRP